MRQPDNESQVLAEISRSEHPNRYPERCTDCIEQNETPPRHAQHSRHDAVELTQNAKEASEQNCRGAVAHIHTFDPVEAFVGETDLCAMAQNCISSELSADQIA